MALGTCGDAESEKGQILNGSSKGQILNGSSKGRANAAETLRREGVEGWRQVGGKLLAWYSQISLLLARVFIDKNSVFELLPRWHVIIEFSTQPLTMP
jgi:hypothetical protein